MSILVLDELHSILILAPKFLNILASSLKKPSCGSRRLKVGRNAGRVLDGKSRNKSWERERYDKVEGPKFVGIT